MNLHERISTIEVHFRSYLVDPIAPFVSFPEDLWDALGFDRVSKAVGWSAFRNPIGQGANLDDLSLADAALFLDPSPLSVCPPRIATTTRYLTDELLHRYLHSVTGYAHAVWELRCLADVEERHRRAESTFYDRDPEGFELINEIAFQAMTPTP